MQNFFFAIFFQNRIKIGLIFYNEQKFHSSSMIFWTFKNPLDKKFFFQAQNFDCHRCRLTLGPKITLEVWFHNREAGGIFLGGYGEKWLKRCWHPPSPLPKSVISISCVESIAFLTLYPFFHLFNQKLCNFLYSQNMR